MEDGTRWANEHDECRGCGTQDVQHRARGLCARCYSRSILRNGWPIWIEGCIRCGVSWDEASYRSSGLCYSCVTACRKSGEMEKWRTQFILVRAQCREGGMKPLNALALRIGRTIGATTAAAELGVDRSTFRAWALGISPVPAAEKAALIELGRRCSRFSYEL